MTITRGLIIDSRWIDLILAGKKDWEMRSQRINFRERIGLIKKKTKTVVGVGDAVDVIGPINDAQALANIHHHGVPADEIELLRRWRYAWVLKGVMPLKTSIPYAHQKGHQVWVDLDGRCMKSLAEAVEHAGPLESKFDGEHLGNHRRL